MPGDTPSEPAVDRRKQRRRPTRLPGVVHLADWSGEVRLQDVTAEAVAFACPRPANVGDHATLKIGIGPTRQAVRIEVVRCVADEKAFVIAAKFCGAG